MLYFRSGNSVVCLYTAQTYTRQTTDNTHRAQCYSAAAHTPSVRDTPICAVLLWLVAFVGACGPYSTIYLSVLPMRVADPRTLWTEM